MLTEDPTEVWRWLDRRGCGASNKKGTDNLWQLEKAVDDVRMIENNETETLGYDATQSHTEWEWKTVGFREYVLFLYTENCIL